MVLGRTGSAGRSVPAMVSALLALMAANAIAGGGPTEADASTADGVYTKAQAKSGEGLYEVHCLTCHDKVYFRPVLKRWHGQSVSVLFDVMAGSMPESNPGGLLNDEYLDILAYIFSRSRYPAADEPLSMDRLAVITIEDP